MCHSLISDSNYWLNRIWEFHNGEASVRAAFPPAHIHITHSNTLQVNSIPLELINTWIQAPVSTPHATPPGTGVFGQLTPGPNKVISTSRRSSHSPSHLAATMDMFNPGKAEPGDPPPPFPNDLYLHCPASQESQTIYQGALAVTPEIYEVKHRRHLKPYLA